MTTTAPACLKWCAQQIVRHYPSAVLSGIVPDQRHLAGGGYHVSIADLGRYGNAGDYSNRRPLDKAPPVTAAGRQLAAAHDVSLARTDMIKFHGRVRAVWLNRKADTRTKYVNAINCWDGSGDAIRYDFTAGTSARASSDHTYHEHTDQPRVYVDEQYNHDSAWRAARAVVSIATGQTHDQWQRQEKLGPYATTGDIVLDAPTLKQVQEAAGVGVHGQRLGHSGPSIGTAVQTTYQRTGRIEGKLDALLAAQADDDEQLAAALDKIPTAQQYADAVFERLGSGDPNDPDAVEQLADNLRELLGADRAAALAAALTADQPAQP